MTVVCRLANKFSKLYKQHVVREQYPFLTALSRERLQKESALGVIYMLHHIAPKDKSRIPTNEDLKVSPEFLEKTIKTYKCHKIDFLSLDEIYSRLTLGIAFKNPFVAFTIDDGYLDNYTNAYPIFKKYGVPFTIFVTTDFIDKKAILWWDCLEELILTHDTITISDGSNYPCKTYNQRWDTFRYLREKILMLDQRNLLSELNNMFTDYSIDWLLPVMSKAMSWNQVKKLSCDPLCTIGGHSISHPALSSLTDEDAVNEIINGNKIIEEYIQKKVEYFAYPYGTPNEVGDREMNIIKQSYINMAFFAHKGCVTTEDSKKLVSLPRFYFHES